MEWFTKFTVLYECLRLERRAMAMFFFSLVVGIDVQLSKRKSCSLRMIRARSGRSLSSVIMLGERKLKMFTETN